MADTLTQRLLDKDYGELKDDIETVVASKIVSKIGDKKQDIIDKINAKKSDSKSEEAEKEEEEKKEEE